MQSPLPSIETILSNTTSRLQTPQSFSPSIPSPPPRTRGRSRAASSRRVDELCNELLHVEKETERLRSISQRSSSLGGFGLQNGKYQEPLIKVTIPTLEMRNSAAESKKERLYVAYVIQVQTGSVQWRLARRFSEFYNLHNMLRKSDKTTKKILSTLPKLPSKRMKLGTSKFDPKYTLERREKLELYITALIACINIESNEIVDDFLEYTEHMILSSVTALRTMQGDRGNRIADMLQSSMNKTHKRHFSRKSSHAMLGTNNNNAGIASMKISSNISIASSTDLGDR